MRMHESSDATREGLDPLDGADWLGITQRGNDRVQVREVVNFDVEVKRLEAAVAVNELKVDDVGVLLAEYPRHGTKRAGNIAQDHSEAGRAAV